MTTDETTRTLEVRPMGVAAQVLLVANRELTETARNKTFRNSLFITAGIVVIVVAAVSILPRLFGSDLAIGLLPEGQVVADALPEQPDGEPIELTELSDRDAAVAALEAGDVDAVVVGPRDVLVDSDLDPGTAALLQNAVSTAQLAEAAGVAPQVVRDSAEVQLQVERLDPPDPAQAQRRAMTTFGVLAALGQVIGGAFLVANGVVEEKSSRVIEVVMSKVSPRILLTGKLLGLGVICLAQLAVLVATGLVAVAFSPDLSIPPGLLGASGAILGWYLLAYVIFASLFSIAGALTARQEDMAQKVQPMMYLLFAVFGASFFAFSNPDSMLARVTSFVPFTAPGVIPARQAVSQVPGWEVAVAVVLALAAGAASLWFAGSVYTGGALKMRGKSSIRSALSRT